MSIKVERFPWAEDLEYAVNHLSNYGGWHTCHEGLTYFEARMEVAKRLRYLRKQGYPISVLSPGNYWEVEEPEDNQGLVPPACGRYEIRCTTPPEPMDLDDLYDLHDDAFQEQYEYIH